MTFSDPVLDCLEVLIYVSSHGCPTQLGTVSGHSVLEVSSSLEPTLEPHRVMVDPGLYLGGCIHSVKVITLYQTAKHLQMFL